MTIYETGPVTSDALVLSLIPWPTLQEVRRGTHGMVDAECPATLSMVYTVPLYTLVLQGPYG